MLDQMLFERNIGARVLERSLGHWTMIEHDRTTGRTLYSSRDHIQ